MTEMNPELQGLIIELKKTVESKQAETTESAAKMSVLEDKIIALESKLADDSKAEEAKAVVEAQLASLQDTVKNVEKKLYRTPNVGSNPMDSEMKDFASLLRTRNEAKYLRTDSDVEGGYLLPEQMSTQLIEKMIEVSDFRRIANVVQIGTRELILPGLDADVTVSYVGEAGANTTTSPTFNQIIIPAHRSTAQYIATVESLQDAAYDILGVLTRRVGEKFAEREGLAFLSGTGVNQPQGILTAAGTTNVNSGNATLITADALLDMRAQLKYQNQVFLMNRRTLMAIRKLKTGAGDYLWNGGLNGAGNTAANATGGYIDGVPVLIMNDMPEIGAGLKPVVLLDAQRAYTIVDRVGMAITRDDLTLVSNGQVKFVMARRSGGGVTLPEAIVTLTISV